VGLRVISYNVQFLPLRILNKRSKPAYRAARIAELLAEYDLVGLNEVFDSKRREQILKAFQKAWGPNFHCVLPNPEDRSRFGLDSGLVLLSRLPIVESHTLKFGNDSTYAEQGIRSDGYANKGVLHARLAVPSSDGRSMAVDVFLTHLESQNAVRRRQQYALMAEFVRRHSSPQAAIIAMGDFNTRGGAAELRDAGSPYHELLGDFAAVRPKWFDLGSLRGGEGHGTSAPEQPGGGNRIDYIFAADAIQGAGLRSAESKVEHFPDAKVEFLSDHCAASAALEW